jgi:hypothetical protein
MRPFSERQPGINPTQVCLDAVEACQDVGLPRHVAAEADGRAAEGLNLSGGALGVRFLEVGDGDIRALSRQAEDDPSADPGAAPGHDRHLPGKSHRITLPHSVPDMTGLVSITPRHSTRPR